MLSDNGPGIPVGREREIFRKFATFADGDRPKGTGLGLAICQAIAIAHGGDIWVERAQPQGSRFVLRLPATLVVTGDMA